MKLPFYRILWIFWSVTVTVRLPVTVSVMHYGAKTHTGDNADYMHTVYLNTNSQYSWLRSGPQMGRTTTEHTGTERPPQRVGNVVQGWTVAECLPCGGVFTSRCDTEERPERTSGRTFELWGHGTSNVKMAVMRGVCRVWWIIIDYW